MTRHIPFYLTLLAAIFLSPAFAAEYQTESDTFTISPQGAQIEVELSSQYKDQIKQSWDGGGFSTGVLHVGNESFEMMANERACNNNGCPFRSKNNDQKEKIEAALASASEVSFDVFAPYSDETVLSVSSGLSGGSASAAEEQSAEDAADVEPAAEEQAEPEEQAAAPANEYAKKCQNDYVLNMYYDCACMGNAANNPEVMAAHKANYEKRIADSQERIDNIKANLAKNKAAGVKVSEAGYEQKIQREEDNIARGKAKMNEAIAPQDMMNLITAEGLCKQGEGIKADNIKKCEASGGNANGYCACVGDKAAAKWLALDDTIDSKHIVRIAKESRLECKG